MNEGERYEKICSKLSITPQMRVMEGLNKNCLNLKSRHLGCLQVIAIAEALHNNSSIVNFNLEDNNATAKGIAKLCSILKQNLSLQLLNIGGNSIGKEGSAFVAELLMVNESLKELNLSSNNFDASAVAHLCQGLKMNSTLCVLNLSRNFIDEVGAYHLSLGLNENRCLTELDLSWNRLLGKGAVVLFKFLHLNKTLKRIDVSWNGLGYEGSLAIREFLKKNSNLEELHLNDNRINWEGAIFISQGLKQNTNLKYLGLAKNPLTTTGCLDVIDAVGRSKLRKLDLGDTSVTGEFEIIVMMIKKERHFECKHGGVVPSHDILGQRQGRKVEPMQRVIDYMKVKQLRPTELFRSFDKKVTKLLSFENFMERLEKCGIKLYKHEIAELMKHIQITTAEEADSTSVNYKKMINSVQKQIKAERLVKAAERQRKLKLQDYHREILNHSVGMTSNSNTTSNLNETEELKDKFNYSSRLSSLPSSNLNDIEKSMKVQRHSLPALNHHAVVSMSGDLGKKVNIFPSPRLLSNIKSRKT
ncbi:DgyrCDS13048 [Dimorphilus gyrociliatus]|uniref:DgyrCDS13048 n=1 Tax=Dimorphilus gyrociliatus TaxID=2664684 RepID=A0A7I8W9G7_9ANNE|nr:DgyrCDS13048 [Dimorphilus gyrociliatus]